MRWRVRFNISPTFTCSKGFEFCFVIITRADDSTWFKRALPGKQRVSRQLKNGRQVVFLPRDLTLPDVEKWYYTGHYGITGLPVNTQKTHTHAQARPCFDFFCVFEPQHHRSLNHGAAKEADKASRQRGVWCWKVLQQSLKKRTTPLNPRWL